MMNRDDLIKMIKEGKRVVIMLNKADVVMSRSHPMALKNNQVADLAKIVVKDPIFGAVYFSGFSEKLFKMFARDGINAQVSLKVIVTGMGQPTDKYPEPMLFATPHLKKGDPLEIDFPVDATQMDSDLPVNV